MHRQRVQLGGPPASGGIVYSDCLDVCLSHASWGFCSLLLPPLLQQFAQGVLVIACPALRSPVQRAPRFLLVENVVGFETSDTRDALVETLRGAGYEMQVGAMPQSSSLVLAVG